MFRRQSREEFWAVALGLWPGEPCDEVRFARKMLERAPERVD